jgi:DNA primase
MYYPEELIEEIRLNNNIVDIISQNVKLTKKGNGYFGLCPFHNEKTPSFSVSEEKQMYYCFGCGAGGNVITYVMEYENYSFIEGIKYLADRVNIVLPEANISQEVRKEMNYKQILMNVNKDAARYFYYQLTHKQGNKALEYLLNRGITNETIKKFGLGFSNFIRADLYDFLSGKDYEKSALVESGLIIEDNKQADTYVDRFYNRIMFPIFDVHGRVIAFGGRALGDFNPKYLNSPETKIFDKSNNLYGLNIARASRRPNIILVEGYMDVIALHQGGFNNAVASLGTAFTPSQARLIKRYAKEVIICYDSDGAGIKAAIRAIPILEGTGLIVRVLVVKNHKDPDEFIKNEGSEAFERLLDEAMPAFIFEIEQLQKQYNLADPEDKTQFFQGIAKKLIGLENEIKRDNYFEVMAKKYGIKPEALKKEMDTIAKNTGIVSSDRKDTVGYNKALAKDTSDTIVLAQKNILTFIVSHKDIYEKVKGYIAIEEFTNGFYKQLATIVFGLYEKNEAIEPATIVNKFLELSDQKKVAELFNNNLQVDNQLQLEKMINESIYILKNAYIDKLSREANEITKLQEVIARKKKLQTLYISL